MHELTLYHNSIVNPEVSPNKQEVCPGDNVTITCDIWDSESIAWSSDEYIGIDRQVNFTFHETGGIQISPTVVTTVTNTSSKNGVRLVKCALNFTVSSNILSQIHTVTCINVALDTNTTASLKKAGKSMCTYNS